jgi:release factor glutamine methyltransferase
MQSESSKPGIQYDVIVSNPPYIPSEGLAGLMPDVLRFEPRIALDGGPDGLVFYRRLLQISKDLLKPGGLLAVEIGYDQRNTVSDLFREAGFVPILHYDFGGNPRVVTGLFSSERRGA